MFGLAESLAEDGFHVVVFDLYGRGFSSAERAHTPELFVEQTAAVLEHIATLYNKPSRAHIVGLSMGGAVAAHFGAAFPSRVQSIVFASPAGLPGVVVPWYGDVIAWPFVGRALLEFLYVPITLQRFVSYYNVIDAATVARVHEIIVHHHQKPRFYEGLISTMHNFPLTNSTRAYAQCAAHKLPMFFVWGTDDTVTPYVGAAHGVQLTNAELLTLSRGRHLALAEYANITYPTIARFFRDPHSSPIVSNA